MILKLAVLALALLVAWLLLFRPRRKVPRRKPAPPPVTALELCPRCRVYRLPDGDCACEPPPAVR